MTSVRLLTAAMLVCTASAFGQEQLSSATRPSRTAEPDKSVRGTTSEPWKSVPNQPADSRAGKNRLEQLQIDRYKIDPSRIEPSGRPLGLDWRVDPMIVVSDGQLGDDTVCYKIRSYVVARDSKDSDSVHPVGYSTCQPASRYRLRRTQIQSDSSDR